MTRVGGGPQLLIPKLVYYIRLQELKSRNEGNILREIIQKAVHIEESDINIQGKSE